MLRTIAVLMIVLNVVICRPQFVSVKDGKIGVNFGGYHAEAGLGALLTGDAAHGGLSASAGTPYGQNAAAGIGAGTGDYSQGGAYANANAGGNVGASAGLGAVAGGDAGLGAEAHVGGLSSSAGGTGGTGFHVSKTVPYRSSSAVQQTADYNGNTNVIYRYGGEFDGNVQTDIVTESHVQRIKPPKKYSRIHGHAHVAQPSNTVKIVEKEVVPQPQQVFVTKEVETVPVVQTSVVTKTKSLPPSVVYQPIAQPPIVGGYTKTKQVSYGGAGAGGGGGVASGSFQGNFNSAGLFDSIFNIPIATLKAVNGLVNNVAGGVSASGGVAVSKSVGSY